MAMSTRRQFINTWIAGYLLPANHGIVVRSFPALLKSPGRLRAAARN